MQSAAALLAVGLSACLRPDVMRVYDGMLERGRFINDGAYALYTRGAEHEARAELDAALQAYVAAASYDPDSVEVWTRVGKLRCMLENATDAASAFREAAEADARYEPLWRARAECAERSDDDAALSYARRAVELDPEQDEAVLLYARLLDGTGRRAEAAAWLRALSLRSPASMDAWRAVRVHAAASGDLAWRDHADRQCRALEALQRPHHPDKGDTAEPWRAIDAALAADDLPLAKSRARALRLDGRAVAARAIARGKPRLARADAELRSAADPSDSDARVTLALALDLAGESERGAEVVADLPRDFESLSEVGLLMLVELVSRHAGREAAGRLPDHVASPPGARVTSAARARSELEAMLRRRAAGNGAGP